MTEQEIEDTYMAIVSERLETLKKCIATPTLYNRNWDKLKEQFSSLESEMAELFSARAFLANYRKVSKLKQ